MYIFWLPSLCLRSRCFAIANVPYRTLAHSHSATRLNNKANQWLVYIKHILPASNLRTGIVRPRVIVLFFAISASRISLFYLELAVLFSRHSTCDIIPKLSINMEFYPYLVSSQIPHIFVIYLNTKFVQTPHNYSNTL